MDRRAALTLVAVTALAGLLGPGAAYGQDTVRIGVVGPRTGFMAAGAAVTHWPNFKLWAQEINDRGGLKLKAGQRKIEMIEYDDRSQPAEAIKAVERLATQDKVDFIMPVYGTGWNLAVAPVFAKYGYPQVTQAGSRPASTSSTTNPIRTRRRISHRSSRR
jgi:branched-chain amino acid transport system substrate-binding protein